MLWLLAAIAVMLVFTVLAFRKNAVALLSLSFTLIYVIEVLIYYTDRNYINTFFMVLGAKYPLDWGVITGIYLHSLSPGHVFFNILFFFLAGMPFEDEIGSRKFTTIFLISGITANIGYSLYLYAYGMHTILVGASGAIFGIMGAFIIMYPEKRITMFFGPIIMPRIKVKYAILVLLLTEFVLSMLWVQDSVAHGAHVLGAVAGAAMGYYLKRKAPDLSGGPPNIVRETFEELADTPALREIKEKILNEDDPLIQKMWIEKFFTEKFGNARIEGKYAEADGKKYRIYR